MKTNIKKVVACYKALGEADVNTLDENEAIKVIDARKVMRPIADAYDAYLKDVQEKFKPEDWDKIQEDFQKWQQEGDSVSLSDERKKEINQKMVDYGKKIDAALKKELEQDRKSVV